MLGTSCQCMGCSSILKKISRTIWLIPITELLTTALSCVLPYPINGVLVVILIIISSFTMWIGTITSIKQFHRSLITRLITIPTSLIDSLTRSMRARPITSFKTG